MVYILVFVAVISEAPTKIDVDLRLFETKERCERNISYVKAQLEETYSKVTVACFAKELNKGK